MTPLSPRNVYKFLCDCLDPETNPVVRVYRDYNVRKFLCACLDPKANPTVRIYSAASVSAFTILSFVVVFKLGKWIISLTKRNYPPKPSDQINNKEKELDRNVSKNTKNQDIIENRQDNPSEEENPNPLKTNMPPIAVNDQDGQNGKKQTESSPNNLKNNEKQEDIVKKNLQSNLTTLNGPKKLSQNDVDNLARKSSIDDPDNIRMKKTADPIKKEHTDIEGMNFDKLVGYLGRNRLIEYLQKINTSETQPETVPKDVNFSNIEKRAAYLLKALNQPKKKKGSYNTMLDPQQLKKRHTKDIIVALRFLVLRGDIHAFCYYSISEKYVIFFNQDELNTFSQNNKENYIVSQKSLLSLMKICHPVLEFVPFILDGENHERNYRNYPFEITTEFDQFFDFYYFFQRVIIDRWYKREVFKENNMKPIDLGEFKSSSKSLRTYAVDILDQMLKKGTISVFGLNLENPNQVLLFDEKDSLDTKTFVQSKNLRWYKLFDEEIKEVECQVDENGKIVFSEKLVESKKEQK